MNQKLMPENWEELFKERLLKLDPEQQAIAIKWEEERKQRLKILDDFDKGPHKDIGLLIDILGASCPDRCEHDRAIMGTCAGCDEIERAIYPEAFEDEEE